MLDTSPLKKNKYETENPIIKSNNITSNTITLNETCAMVKKVNYKKEKLQS